MAAMYFGIAAAAALVLALAWLVIQEPTDRQSWAGVGVLFGLLITTTLGIAFSINETPRRTQA
jgi:hypothetical protein